ncbi:MAG: hypothetical protein KJN89_09485 [Gammaproteobacteria bacterium]|nr:hypothetical protein [Gammaproteobacteria bacterium]MBT8134359.1 hypothetical protein [Gammaproteobacteria bacterium]NNJ50596.1 hypothetical protein [Gammaproteobacteria bacterium]
MNRRSVIKGLQIAGYLTTALYTTSSYADWSQKQPYGGYNKGYGDFPPLDIDQQLSGLGDERSTEQNQTQPAQNTEAKVNQQTAISNAAQNTAIQPAQPAAQPALQQPAYGGYYQNQMPNAYGTRPYYRGSSYGPWNNRRTGFYGPWNNRGSGFSGPWGGRNGGPSFTGPWNNNASSFSVPWNNNRSGLSPWGNGGGWSW